LLSWKWLTGSAATKIAAASAQMFQSLLSWKWLTGEMVQTDPLLAKHLFQSLLSWKWLTGTRDKEPEAIAAEIKMAIDRGLASSGSEVG
jgi:hypothetical protein